MTAFAFAFVIVATLLAESTAGENQTDFVRSQVHISQSGLFRMTYISKLDPIVINRIHSWVLHVETADGQPVESADITTVGGMPLHNHGLPTIPRMTQSLGNGDYLIEGMRFHMNGYWEIAITIDAGGKRDTVVIPLEL
jgi:YtkA-like